MPQTAWIPFQQLENFMADAFKAIGVPEADAKICADVLITSDKRGIDSHGVGRLKPIYYDRIVKQKIQQPVTQFEVVRDNAATAVVDGRHGVTRLEELVDEALLCPLLAVLAHLVRHEDKGLGLRIFPQTAVNHESVGARRLEFNGSGRSCGRGAGRIGTTGGSERRKQADY